MVPIMHVFYKFLPNSLVYRFIRTYLSPSRLWDVTKQICVDTIEHHTEFVYGLDFNMHVPDQV